MERILNIIIYNYNYLMTAIQQYKNPYTSSIVIKFEKREKIMISYELIIFLFLL